MDIFWISVSLRSLLRNQCNAQVTIWRRYKSQKQISLLNGSFALEKEILVLSTETSSTNKDDNSLVHCRLLQRPDMKTVAFLCSSILVGDFPFNLALVGLTKAKFRRRTSYKPNGMLMRVNKGFFSFAFDSAHVMYGVWSWPKILNGSKTETLS